MWIVVSQFNCPSYSVYVRFRELFQSLHYSAVYADPALLSVTRNGDAWSQLPLWMELTDLVGQILEAQLDYDEHYWFQWWAHLGISWLHGKGEQGAARLDSLNHINRNNWWWTSLIGLITGQRSNWTEFYELNSPSQLLTTLFRNKRGQSFQLLFLVLPLPINPLLLFHPYYQCQCQSSIVLLLLLQLWIDSIEFHNDQEIVSVSSSPLATTTEIRELNYVITGPMQNVTFVLNWKSFTSPFV